MQEHLDKLKAAMTPDQRVDGMRRTFSTVTGYMVEHMRMKGGNPMLPARDRAGIDYVTLISSGEGEDLRTIDLYAANMWGGVNGKYFEPIGLVEDVTPDILLQIYGPRKDDGLIKHVEEVIPFKLADLDGKEDDQEAKKAYLEHVEPAVSGYIDEHREALMEDLIRDMTVAFDAVLRPQIQKA